MPAVSNNLLRELKQAVGKAYVHHAPEVLSTYESDACLLMQKAPDLVVLPATTTEVAAVVKLCNQYNVPYIARGAGTGLSGGSLPVQGGVFIGLARMNQILEIDVGNQTATVETGVINAWLTRDTKQFGLFFAPDPSSQSACTLGGNIAENAGGIHCVRYGVTVDHILALEVVTPEGDIIWLGGPHGHSRGVNWVGLFVGSEGTLGIATRAIVRLMKTPPCIRVYLAAFRQLSDATDAASAIMASGMKPSALELMDDVTIQAVNAAFDVGFPEDAEAVLLIELAGTAEDLIEGERRLDPILATASQRQFAEDEAERNKLWRSRKGAVAAYGRILPAFYLHDCVIPRSQLTPVLRQIQAIGQKYNLIIGNVFHAGDGNLHPNILLDPADAEMIQRVLAAGEEILDACLAVGGVLSGEHGIGMEKSEFMTLQFTDSELAVMGRLKTVFDPIGLCNPDKILPVRTSCGEVRRGEMQRYLPHLSSKMISTKVGWI